MHSLAVTPFLAWYYEDMDKNKILLISVSVIVVLGVALGYYYMKKSASPSTSDLQTAVTQGVIPSIGAAANPLTNKPDINPTSKTNPFNAVKINPFQ